MTRVKRTIDELPFTPERTLTTTTLIEEDLSYSEQKSVNAGWLAQNFPCAEACPVHTEAGRYVNLIAQGRWEDAYRIARLPNPFASICGRICAAPCEDSCRRKELDDPVSIRALKRFVCEKYGVESLIDISRIRDVFRPKLPPKDKWVAIIGAGPAGMTAAHDLALIGYRVTVFEAQEVAGGMLRLGIPEYRLPRELIRMEINAILNLGVELKLGKRLGRDFTIQDLKDNGYTAIFLALGAHKSRDLNIEGIELDGVLRGVDFLLNANLNYRVELGQRIIVIGGGNVAIDVARTALRQERLEEVASSI
ncbi:MAG: FAD-dependent oxidoreductase, partial [Candidatus Marinimicrobia bacterium]|nr:FAD-dependent oxidoreductase [Candidatus Neomarinimicrobiota bacterium]